MDPSQEIFFRHSRSVTYGWLHLQGLALIVSWFVWTSQNPNIWLFSFCLSLVYLIKNALFQQVILIISCLFYRKIRQGDCHYNAFYCISVVHSWIFTDLSLPWPLFSFRILCTYVTPDLKRFITLPMLKLIDVVGCKAELSLSTFVLWFFVCCCSYWSFMFHVNREKMTATQILLKQNTIGGRLLF